MNPKVDVYFKTAKHWREESEALRTILLGCPLAEELKWGKPCYTHAGANVVLIHGFKDYCALLFLKGALLKDPEKILVQQTENTQSARQIRFRSVPEIAAMRATLTKYVQEAIAVETSGTKVPFKQTHTFNVPEEFQARLNNTPGLKAAFAALTPGRQRGYILYFSSAKQSSTRTSRVEKHIPQILAGKGLDDA